MAAPAVGGVHCSQSTSCTFTGGAFLACIDSYNCAAPTGTCCLHHDDTADCESSCASPDQVVCDPNAPTCGAGQHCVQTTAGTGGFANVYVCQ